MLDEATASLHAENEPLPQRAISRLASGKTVVVIVHRLRIFVDEEQIIVLNKGRLEEQDTIGSYFKKVA